LAVLIDASIPIEYERRRLDLERYLAHRQREEFFLSVVTASELLHSLSGCTEQSTAVDYLSQDQLSLSP
jgi:predicted nucleic acid-binding protein